MWIEDIAVRPLLGITYISGDLLIFDYANYNVNPSAKLIHV
jgi:hypothetical protein